MAHIALRNWNPGKIQHGRRQIDQADEPLLLLASLEWTAADNQRRVGGRIMAATFILQISRFKVGAMVAGVDEDGVFIQAFLLEPCHQPAHVFIQPVDCRHIIRVHFLIIAL